PGEGEPTPLLRHARGALQDLYDGEITVDLQHGAVPPLTGGQAYRRHVVVAGAGSAADDHQRSAQFQHVRELHWRPSGQHGHNVSNAVSMAAAPRATVSGSSGPASSRARTSGPKS